MTYGKFMEKNFTFKKWRNDMMVTKLMAKWNMHVRATLSLFFCFLPPPPKQKESSDSRFFFFFFFFAEPSDSRLIISKVCSIISLRGLGALAHCNNEQYSIYVNIYIYIYNTYNQVSRWGNGQWSISTSPM